MSFQARVSAGTRFLITSVFILGSIFGLQAQGDCDCTNCPQFMPDNFTGSFFINVQNAANPTLGQNGQGVCGVSLSMDHEYIGDLRITLTSPAGQTVTLVGPIGLFGATDGTEWNINFVPCSSPDVAPDPGFSATWNNNQSWGLGGMYTGTYYPATGCLQNFNTGSVNGTWSLTVTDGQASDVGNFYDYEIIFCDPSGITCFSCAANAGELLQPNVTACQGSSLLDLDLPPTFTPASAEPPAGEYSYTYVISGAGGIIEGYDPAADLSSYPEGMYTVCGMSYLTAQESLIPSPNGALTMTQLRNMLNSTTPPFCGKITTNCVNVTINAAPQDVENTVEICGPGCYFFNGVNRCQSGTYVANLQQNGCPYTSTLYLTIKQPSIKNIVEVICDGGCSSNPSFPSACSGGFYTTTLMNEAGCDSTVNLTVTVISANAVINNAPEVPCGGGTVQLSGLGSSVGGGYSYTWTASNGGNIVSGANSLNANVNEAGDYQLKVCRVSGAVSCCDSAQVTLTAATTTPTPPAAIFGQTSVCKGQTRSYNITPVSGATSYTWTFPSGVVINSGGSTVVNNVTWATGTGGAVCVSANSSCGISDPVCIDVVVDSVPVVSIPQGPITVCSSDTSTYTIPSIDNATSYTWSVTAPAQIISGQNSNTIRIKWNGSTSANVCVYAINSCGPGTQRCLPVVISPSPVKPVISGPTTACAGAVSTYSIAAIPGSPNYIWTATNGVVGMPTNTTTVQVTWNTGVTSGIICVHAANSCGVSPDTCLTVSLGVPPPQATISGPTQLCAGDTAVYSVTAIPGATGYTWQVPVGASIVSGQNTTSATVVWNSAPGGNVGIIVAGSCGAAPVVNYPVIVHAIPMANAGINQQLCGLSTQLDASGGAGQWTVVSGPGTITFVNSGSDSSVVTTTLPGTHLFNWTVNSFGCLDSDTVSVQFNSSPVAGAITPVCDNANENYTISFPISGGLSPYTVPGGTVTNGVFTSAPIVSAQPYQFVITDANGCQSTAISGAFNCNCATNAGTMVLTPLEVCEGDTAFSVTVLPPVLDGNDVRSFVLHEGSGTALVNPIAQNTTGQFTFQAGMVFSQTYYISSVAGNNMGGFPAASDPCRSISQGQPVIFYQNPVANAGLDSDTCGLSIILAAGTGIGQGTWSVATSPAGGTLTFANVNNPTSVATSNVFGAYTLVWTLNNHSCTATDQVNITFHGSPSAGTVVPTCNATNTAYTVTFPIVGGAAPYLVNGTTVAAGGSYTSAPINSGVAYSFVITDANGCISAPVTGSAICDCTTDAGTMTLTLLEVCEGDTAVSITALPPVLDGNDVRSFVLHEGSGMLLVNPIAQNTTGQFTFQTGMVFGQTYYISSVAGNDMGGFPADSDPCRSISQGQPVVFYQNPVANAGLDSDTCGLSIILAAGTGIGQGTWSVATSPAGGILTFANVNNPTSVATSNVFGAYTLVWTLNNHSCTATDQVNISFHGSPSAGTVVPTCNATNTAYTVTFPIAGGAAPYLVNGTTVAAGGSYTSVPINSGVAYSFVITDANGCISAPVTGSAICDCTTDAGAMSLQPLSACSGDTITALHIAGSEVLDGDDVTGYVLHEGSGAIIVNPVAQNTTGAFVFGAGMTYGQTYYVSYVAGNPSSGFPTSSDPCFSVAPGQPVVFLANPAPNAGVDSEICGNTITLAATQSSFSGVWTFISGPGGAAFSNAQAANSTVTVGQAGSYVFRWTETNVICTEFDEVSIDFNAIPTAAISDEVCNSTSTQYQVILQVSNGVGPYTTTGLAGTFAGTTFTSALVPSNTTYSVVITDANGCSTAPLSGIKNCNCLTSAGTMNTAPLKFCVDMPAVAVWNNDGQLDGDDMAGFILHTQAGTVPGQILGVSAIPQFNFGSTLSVGTTYYISAIAGNNVNGVIDPNDICLSVAPGTPVQWKALPTATLSGTTNICEGSSAQLTFGGTGDYPLSIIWSDGSGTNQTATLSSGTSVVVPVTPDVTTIYNLVSVSDGTLPTCSATQTGSATITVRQPLSAGTAATTPAFCQDNSTSVVLSGLITGADAGGAWTETSLVPSTGGGFNAGAGTFNTAGQAPGIYRFAYTVTPQAPCPTDQEQVQVTIHPQPVADAGADKTLDCDVTSAVLGGTGTTLGVGISYVWLNGSAAVGGNNPTLEVVEGGNYSLAVTNTFGCTDQDNVVVTLDNEQPQIGAIQKQDISCFGKGDGSIRVLTVTGGHPPYLYSLNGEAFSAQKDFVGLVAGNYQIEVLDANGCSSTTDFINIVEPPLLVTDLGGNLNVSLGDSIALQAQVNRPLSALDTIIWQPVFDAANAQSLFQYFRPIQPTTVDFFVRDTNGCTASDRIVIFVDTRRHVYVPNIFDPAGSGINVLTVYGGRDVEQIKDFKIYDRWGDLMYSTKEFYPNDELKGWDGQWRGKAAQPGVYVWTAVILFKDGETELYSGDVTILK